MADFNQAIKLDPNYADAYFSRGVIHQKKGETDLALADLNQAIKLDSNHAGAYYNRSILYAQLENTSECKKDLKIAGDLFLYQGNIKMSQKIRQILQN